MTYSDLLSPYMRRLVGREAEEGFGDIDGELERSRERRRANDEQALRDAEEFVQQFITPKPAAPVAQPAPQQDSGINWGRAVGEALGKIGGAVVNRLTEDKPEPPEVAPPSQPTIDLKPPTPFSDGTPPPNLPPPTLRPAEPVDDDYARRLMALRPAESNDQLASAATVELPRSRPIEFSLKPSAVAPVSSDDVSRYRRALRPEDVKPSRNLPVPGEEEANDARVRALLEETGRYIEGGGSHTRARVAQPREFLERRISDIELNPTRQNGNSRLVGALKMAGRGALQGFARTGSLAGAAGGAITGGVAGAVDKSLDERFGEQDAVARYRAALQSQYEREGAGLKLDDARAGVRLKNAQAGYAEARPDLEAAKRLDAAAKREQQAVLGNLRLLKGTKLDPSNGQHAALLRRAADAGLYIDPDSFNDASSNLAPVELIDPEHPEQKRRAFVNKVTGEISDVGQSGYVASRDASGMTESERRVDSDRDRAFNALERQRGISNEMARLGLNLSRERFDFAKLGRDDRLSENARKEMGAAAKMRSEAEQAQMDADSFKGAGMYKGDDGVERQAKWAAAKWKAAEDKAEAKRREYFQTYGYLHAPDGGEMKMTMDEFRQLFPNAPNPMASAPSYGVVITDSTQPGTPHTNTYPPRRGMPRSPSATAPRAGEDLNVRAYADQYFGGDYSKAQAAIEEQRRRKGGH